MRSKLNGMQARWRSTRDRAGSAARPWRTLRRAPRIGVAIALACALGALATAAVAQVPTPEITGPITGPGSPFLISTSFPLGPLGYVEEEYFLSGTARSLTSAAPLTSDGEWATSFAGSAAYQTRIVVRRPAEASRFNGAVIVEWLNVSAGFDTAPDWILSHTLMLREGYAWVGVSAQLVGIENPGGGLGLPFALKTVNPARYGVLLHPGDSYSYDLFSQVAMAVRATSGVRPLGNLTPTRVLAAGESQSAFRLTTYVNGVHPLARVYDGFLIHSRGGGSAALSQAPEPPVTTPTVVKVRRDIGTPVLTFQTETDLFAPLSFLAARQRDSRWHRLWEVAGTAHGDLYQLTLGASDQGPAAFDTSYVTPPSAPIPGVIECSSPINIGPQHYVLSAAISALDRWVASGVPPRRQHRLLVKNGAYRLDRDGNVLGGVRSPQLDVPIATLSGLGQSGASFCLLFGTTTPFDSAKLAALYPDHSAFVAKIERAITRAMARGTLLPIDATAIRAAAVAADIP
jgi:hypothetical protein